MWSDAEGERSPPLGRAWGWPGGRAGTRAGGRAGCGGVTSGAGEGGGSRRCVSTDANGPVLGVPLSEAGLCALPGGDAPRAGGAVPGCCRRGDTLGDRVSSLAGSTCATERLGIAEGRRRKGATHRRLAVSRTPAVTARPSRLREEGLLPVDAARTCRTSFAVIGCCCAQHPACRTSVHRRFKTRGTPWAWRTRT